MGQSKPILEKIKRNLDILGISYVDNGSSIVLDTDWTIAYIDADIAKPLGGVDAAVSPFLGIGIGNPGLIQITDSANALNAMIDSSDKQRCLAMLCGFANSIKLVDSGAAIRLLEGCVDLQGMGQ